MKFTSKACNAIKQSYILNVHDYCSSYLWGVKFSGALDGPPHLEKICFALWILRS